MIIALYVIGGVIFGGIVAWLLAVTRIRGQFESRIEEASRRANDAGNRASGLEGTITELRAQTRSAAADFETLRLKLEAAQHDKVKAETELSEVTLHLQEERKLLEEAKSKLTDAFKAIASDTLDNTNASFLRLARETFDKVLAEAKGDLGKNQEALKGLVSPLSEHLKAYDDHVRAIEKSAQDAYSGLTEQLRAVSSGQTQLQKETSNLVTALRKPQVRGRWGEMTLRRVAELAGMCDRCDFSEQVSTDSEAGRLRPDLIVHLPADREVIVDAKVSLEAYLDALSADSEDKRKEAMSRHAAQVRTHMNSLADKNYWAQFARAPEFVVMFIPGESFFGAAVDMDGDLIEDGLKRGVVLATPTTLIALLKAVAYGWRQEQVAKNAQEISELGRQLHERMRTLAEHVAAVGKGLEKANSAYNSAVGSMEGRVMSSARRFKDLGAATGEDIPVIQPVQASIRAVTLLEPADDM